MRPVPSLRPVLTRTAAIAVTGVCALALTACGDDDTKGAKKDAAPSAALSAAEDAVRDYYDLAFAGDAKACDLESPEFAEQLNSEWTVDTCAERMEGFGAFFGTEDRESTYETEAGEGDDEAVVSYTHRDKANEGSGEMTGTHRVVLVDGAWLIGAAEAFAVDGTDLTEDRTVSAQVEEWKEGWCEVRPGVTRDELLGAMGEPTTTSQDDDGQDELEWAEGIISFNAWLEGDEVVSTSVGNVEIAC